MIKRNLLLLFLFVNICYSQAQVVNQNVEWRALNFFLNEQYDEAIDECNAILKIHSNDPAANRTRLILARTHMQLGQYTDALSILNNTQLEAEFFEMGILGLIGDCKSEQGKNQEALDYYLKSIQTENNESLTPYYLFKAFLCAQKLNRPIEANTYIRTILDYFPAYSGQYIVQKHLTIDTVSSLTFSENEITQPETLGIGTVNGERVSVSMFNEAISIARTNAIQQAQQTGTSLQEIDEDRVWMSFVEELALTREYERIQLYTDHEEMMAYLLATDGYAVQPEFASYPAFLDENQVFSSDKLLVRINEMRNAEESEQREAWENTSVYYQKKLRQEKYFNLIGLIPFATSLEVNSKMNENRTYQAHFYVERFRDMPDDNSSISDNDVRSYFEQNKSKMDYRVNDGQRIVSFLKEEIVPTKVDSARAYSKTNTLIRAFEKSKDDSSFVIAHSGLKFYTSGPYSTAVPKDHKQAQYGKYITYPPSVAIEMESAKIGDVVGPYEFGGVLNLAKVIGRTDEVINARHILLSVRGEADDYTREKAQEIFNSVTDANFEEYVRKYSGDTGSTKNGGFLGDFFFGDMVPQFATFCADAPIGEIGFVQTQYGYHIVQVTRRFGNRFPRLGLVTIPIELSDESYNNPESRLEKFRTDFLTHSSNMNLTEAIDSIAQNMGTFVRTARIRDISPILHISDNQAIEDAFLQFAYDADRSIGDISTVFGDSTNFYVAILTEIQKKGIPDFEYVKERMRADLIRDGKASVLSNRIRSLAESKNKLTTREVELKLINPQIPSCGYEPNVVGKAISAYNSGEKEIVVRGNSGVFFVEITEELPIKELEDEATFRNTLYNQNREFIVSSARRTLTEINQIVDNRIFNRLGMRP